METQVRLNKKVYAMEEYIRSFLNDTIKNTDKLPYKVTLLGEPVSIRGNFEDEFLCKAIHVTLGEYELTVRAREIILITELELLKRLMQFLRETVAYTAARDYLTLSGNHKLITYADRDNNNEKLALEDSLPYESSY